MRAQLYDDADYVRVFDHLGQSFGNCLMDCHSTSQPPIGQDAADVALHRCGLRRTAAWKRYREAHMFEAPVRFTFIRHKKKT